MSFLTSKPEKLNIQPLSDWIPFSDKPLIIAGPCSAETEEQLFETAEKIISSTPISYFRAGIWKPRTRPGAFEGIGVEALPWLKKVREHFDVPVIVEVALPEHVEACLAHDVDAFWIGARTTVNPINVQKLAEALSRRDIPVFVKNPINPDLSLWIGAIERLNSAGLKKLVAVHRGFSSLVRTEYRNDPFWQIPIELKRRYPELPIICDPSHITGDSEKVFNVSQFALDLNMNGLMIETHCNPKEAWSDASQQLTPEELLNLLKRLRFRTTHGDSSNPLELNHLRNEIDQIDTELLESLMARFRTVRKIGEVKDRENLPAFQLERWTQILESRLSQGRSLELSDTFVKSFLDLVHEEAIRQQTDTHQA